MKVSVNGSERSLPEQSNVEDLKTLLAKSDPFFQEAKGAAFAVNNQVVPRAEWPKRNLQEGDKVLIIRATQGG